MSRDRRRRWFPCEPTTADPVGRLHRGGQALASFEGPQAAPYREDRTDCSRHEEAYARLMPSFTRAGILSICLSRSPFRTAEAAAVSFLCNAKDNFWKLL